MKKTVWISCAVAAAAALSFGPRGNPVLPDGTIILGDELRPGAGNPGGGI